MLTGVQPVNYVCEKGELQKQAQEKKVTLVVSSVKLGNGCFAHTGLGAQTCSCSSLAAVLLCRVWFALLKIISLAREGRTGMERWWVGAVWSLLDLKHLVQRAELEDSSRQAAGMVTGGKVAFSGSGQSKD